MEVARGRRLWRLRKLHQYADAELHEVPGSDRVELRLLYNGELAYTRRTENRDVALAEAAARRADLERDGWTFHW